MLLFLLTVFMVGHGGCQSIPTEVTAMSVTIQRGILGMEAMLVEGFTELGAKVDQIQGMLGGEKATIEQIWNVTKTINGTTNGTMAAHHPHCNTTATEFQPDRCGNDNLLLTSGERYVVIVDDGNWPTDLFCTVLSNQMMRERDSYSISVDLYNHRAGGSEVEGHLGILYNAEDQDNYDFVYIRPHNKKYCYQTGALVDGRLDWSSGASSRCPHCLRKRTWFSLKVVVKSNTAEIYLNGALMRGGQKMQHPRQASGGVLVANGFENIVHFRNFAMEPIV